MHPPDTYTTDTETLSRQTNSVDSLTDSHNDLLVLQLLVQGDKELRVHGCDKPVQHPMRLAEDD
jgi:hypothetical protein